MVDSNENNFSKFIDNDEIDFMNIIEPLLRRKIFLGSVIGIGLIASVLIAITKKPVWEGQFQVVLSKDNQSSLSILQNEGFQSLLGSSVLPSRGITTEIRILESPSILKPIFDFVKAEKLKKGINISDLRFNEWKKNFSITNERRTTVLDISYLDNDKELILPVITKISNAYQEYSGRDKQKKLALVYDFLNKQIIKYREKSIKDLNLAQSFAMQNDLIPLIGKNNIDEEIIALTNIEEQRIKASNDLKSAKEAIKLINDTEKDPESLIYVGSGIPELRNRKIFVTLREIDIRLSRLRAIFKEDDISIQNLIKEKDFLIKTLSRQTLGYLEATIEGAKKTLKITDRKPGILVKYKQLQKEAARSERILNSLENQKLSIGLEKAQDNMPWELITNPTLLEFPISPNKRRIVMVGFFLSIFGGSLFVLIYEYISGKIFNKKQICSILPFQCLANYEKDTFNNWVSITNLIYKEKLKSNVKHTLGLLNLTSKNTLHTSIILNSFKEIYEENLVISEDLFKLQNCYEIILLITPGSMTFKELKLLLDNILFLGKIKFYWIYINY